MTEAFVQEFEARAGTATAEGPEWLEPIRRAAMERFARTGFPGARDEEWRFTPIGPIAQGTWRPATGGAGELTGEQLAPFVFGHTDWTTLVFVNGVFSEALSAVGELPPGVRVASLAEALRSDGALLHAHLTRHAPIEGSPFTALNTAFLAEGGVVHVGAGVDLATPVHLLFVTTAEAAGTVAHPRNVIVVERGARASIIESYVTLAPGQGYWTNPVTEVAVGAGAWVEHTRIQRESERAQHVGLTHVDQ
jgi:Fe-S cluster assembly protein SufD